ncbi:hypothetical protein LCGC14_0729650 [marine sediment metagenome]|uniref:Uncharacterized protein n=1 Tax=marine sediment metagenome TaxID=412755 RepID=A0A0F9THA2_9ZZZZ
MIKGYCHTNLDGYQRYSWPELFCSVPNIGDKVLTQCHEKSLKVVSITHLLGFEGQPPNAPYPMIRIELHKNY